MVDFGEKRAPKGFMQDNVLDEALRYAAEEPFPVDRLDQNGQRIDERIRLLSSEARTVVPKGRLTRVALVAGAIVGLFAAGASALYIYEKYGAAFEEDAGGTENRDETDLRASDGKREGTQLKTADNLESEVSPLPLSSHASKEHPVPSPRRLETGLRSVLDKQLKLFEGAKARVNQAQYSQALSTLDILDKKYPNGPLAVESQELRAKCLFHMGRFSDAEPLVDKLIRQSRSNRKKAALLRFLGDIQLQLGRCDNAVKSYRRALGLGLKGAESQAAKNGIAKCSP